jgi:hypothetical protein
MTACVARIAARAAVEMPQIFKEIGGIWFLLQ